MPCKQIYNTKSRQIYQLLLLMKYFKYPQNGPNLCTENPSLCKEHLSNIINLPNTFHCSKGSKNTKKKTSDKTIKISIGMCYVVDVLPNYLEMRTCCSESTCTGKMLVCIFLDRSYITDIGIGGQRSMRWTQFWCMAH